MGVCCIVFDIDGVLFKFLFFNFVFVKKIVGGGIFLVKKLRGGLNSPFSFHVFCVLCYFL